MIRHLNLVESDFEHLEKRILPSFPFCFLTFKCSQDETHIFEVKDISSSGMQLGLKSGGHSINEGEVIHGFLRWASETLEVSAKVKWKTSMRLGVEFATGSSSREQMNSFLDLRKIATLMKPVHEMNCGVDFPSQLKYWLRADGPVEVFIWTHNYGELKKFQILMMENFVEWEDTKGLKTARVMSKRNINTPLINEDEFLFKIDDDLDDSKIDKAISLTHNLVEGTVPLEMINFMKMKLGSSN